MIWFSFNSNTYWHVCHNETYRSGVHHFVLYNLLYMRLEYPKNTFARCKTASLSRNFEKLLVNSRITEKDRIILMYILRTSDEWFNFSTWHRCFKKNNKSLLQNADYGYLILVTIDGSRMKFCALKVRFSLTDKQFKTFSEESRFGWRFSRSGITSKGFDNMALVFGFPSYYPTYR